MDPTGPGGGWNSTCFLLRRGGDRQTFSHRGRGGLEFGMFILTTNGKVFPFEPRLLIKFVPNPHLPHQGDPNPTLPKKICPNPSLPNFTFSQPPPAQCAPAQHHLCLPCLTCQSQTPTCPTKIALTPPCPRKSVPTPTCPTSPFSQPPPAQCAPAQPHPSLPCLTCQSQSQPPPALN